MIWWPAVVVSFGLGFAAAWWGAWYRMSRIESEIRALASTVREQMNFDEVPAEWVADQIDWLVQREFP